jgi:outer membrane protein assembly factor BamB
MKHFNLAVTSPLAVILIFLIAGLLIGQDWPQWRGTNRDGKVIGFTAPQEWPTQLTQKWKVTVGLGDATPALVDNKIYVFTRQSEEETIRCLNASDGKELWQDKYQAQAVTGPAARHPGPRSSPTVAEGKVITLGVGGVISCLDGTTGKVIWRKDEFPEIVPRFFAAMSPIVVDGICIAHVGGESEAAVIAYDLVTGNQKWKWTGDGPAYASPVLMRLDETKIIVVQGATKIIGLNVSNGKMLWQIPTPVERRFYSSATPIIDGSTVFYTGQGTGTSAVKIEKQNNNFVVKELWVNQETGTGFNTPVLKDGLLFGLSDKQYLYCMNGKTGETIWTDTERLEGFGSILDAGSVMLGLPSTSELIVYRPSERQFEEIARIKVADTPIYAHPVVSGDRIFVKDEETLALYTIK